MVYSSPNGYGFGNPVFISGYNNCSITFTDLTPGQNIYFQVCAINAGGESQATAVTGVRVSPIGTAPHLIVNGFIRNERTIAPARYYAYNIRGNVTRVIQQKINAGNYVVQHGDAITAGGRYFDSCERSAVALGNIDLKDYHAVYWNLGRQSVSGRTFTPAEQAMVTALLNGGGRLFVSGSEIGWDLDSQGSAQDRLFIRNMLHAAYVADDAATGNVTPTSNGIFKNLGAISFDYAGSGALYQAATPDQLTTAGTPLSTAALLYGTSAGGTAIAGVTYQGNYRTVVLGFPFETIDNIQKRQTLMANTLDFFGDAPSDKPVIAITTPDQTHPLSTTLVQINGTANTAVTGMLTWSNHLTTASGTFDAQPEWSIAIPVAEGINTIHIHGANYLLNATSGDTVAITLDDPILPSTDTDGDGLPDWWELQYFDSRTGAQPHDDPDGDGMTNLEEYLAGTDPLAPGSSLAFMAISCQPHGLVLRWSSVAGRFYSLWHATHPVGPYTRLRSDVIATPPLNTLTLPAPDPGAKRGFYKLQVTWPNAPL